MYRIADHAVAEAVVKSCRQIHALGSKVALWVIVQSNFHMTIGMQIHAL